MCIVAGLSAALLIFTLLLTGIARPGIARSRAVALVLAAAISLSRGICFLPLLLGSGVGRFIALRFADFAIQFLGQAIDFALGAP